MRHLSRARLFLIALLVASGWSCTETLVGVVDVSVVDIAPPSASVFVGESVTLQALTKDDRGNTLNGRPLTWMSENALIASVDAQGRVTGVAAGTTNVIELSAGNLGLDDAAIDALVERGVLVTEGGPDIASCFRRAAGRR